MAFEKQKYVLSSASFYRLRQLFVECMPDAAADFAEVLTRAFSYIDGSLPVVRLGVEWPMAFVLQY